MRKPGGDGTIRSLIASPERGSSRDGGNLTRILASISSGAEARDREPGFPADAFDILTRTGLTGLPIPDASSKRASFAEEWRVLREVARADGSVGRILDGHFNGAERLTMLAPEPLRSKELESISAGRLLVGVWGADPIPGEGEPARLSKRGDRFVLDGVKTFCSGAGGVHRALVLVRSEAGEPGYVAYLDLTDETRYTVDRTWYRAAGMRSSESHRVVFRGTEVMAVLGERSELLREPYFSRDAVRTAVTWAGISARVLDSTLAVLKAKSGGEPDDISSLAAGRMLAHAATIDRWMEDAAKRADENPESLAGGYAVALRHSVSEACRGMMDEAVRACGSHPLATAGDLDRARRDLDLILLQHRLDPALAKLGRERLRNA